MRVPAVRHDPGTKGTVLRFESLKRASRERTIRAGKKAPAVIANPSQSGHSDSALTAGPPATRAVRTFALAAASFRRRSSEQVAANFPRRSLEQVAENSRRSLANRNSIPGSRVRGRVRGLGPSVPKARKAVRSVHALNDLDQDLVRDLVNDLGHDLTAAAASRGTGKNAHSSAISRASRGTRSATGRALPNDPLHLSASGNRSRPVLGNQQSPNSTSPNSAGKNSGRLVLADRNLAVRNPEGRASAGRSLGPAERSLADHRPEGNRAE